MIDPRHDEQRYRDSLEDVSLPREAEADGPQGLAKRSVKHLKGIAGATGSAIGKTAGRAKATTAKLWDAVPGGLAFISQAELLKWSERVTSSAASAYDKALDATYLRTHIGGGHHRMFDGGHDLSGAFEAARHAVADDSFAQEAVGYMSALWKDVTTTKGLPFFTWDQDTYSRCADWTTSHVPWASRDWFYDLCSYDAMELLGAALPVVGAVFALRSDDQSRVTEILGASGFVAVAAANPLAGIAMIGVAGYAYGAKKHRFEGRRFALGAGLAGFSFTLFALLGLPLLIELVIVIAATQLLRRSLPTADEIRDLVVAKVQCRRDVQMAD
jgi:hypothetical protein